MEPRWQVVYEVVSARGFTQINRRWIPGFGGPGITAGRRDGRPAMTKDGQVVGRGDGGQTMRSRLNFERLVRSLPLEMMGNRLVFIALTYPGDWKRWVPDGRTLEAHRRAMVECLRRGWSPDPLIGIWCKEFQSRGAPHFHLYLGLPSWVSAEDYEGFRQRTLLRRRLEARYGTWNGRRRLPRIGGEYGGEAALWLRDAWSSVVGTNGVDRYHHARGVDVSVSFWSEEVALSKSRVEVAAYMAGEMAKWKQKAPPHGFTGVGRFYGTFGRQVGFKPDLQTEVLSEDVGVWVALVMARWVRLRIAGNRRASRVRLGMPEDGSRGEPRGMARKRERDGVTAFGFGEAELARVIRFAERQVERGRVPRRKRRDAMPEIEVATPEEWPEWACEVCAQCGHSGDGCSCVA